MKRLTQNEFIEKTKKIHGNIYDYSKAQYKTGNDKVTIICKEHGEFEQMASTHLSGSGCKYCGIKLQSDKHKKNTDYFIDKAKEVHGDKYDYSKVQYKTMHDKVTIICKEHGEFEQNTQNHLNGQGCPQNRYNKISKSLRLNVDVAFNKIKEMHGNLYEYYDFNNCYKNYRSKIKIICKKHGIFEQSYGHHVSGQGCPSCSLSYGENRVRGFLENNNIDYESQKRFKDCRNKRPLPFDFYLPKYNICIEYNGPQHYKESSLWFDKLLKDKKKENFIRQKKHDTIKKEYCINNNIKLLIISYLDRKELEKILTEEILGGKN